MREDSKYDLLLENYKQQKIKCNNDYSDICGDEVYLLQSRRLEQRTEISYETDTQTPHNACVKYRCGDGTYRKSVWMSELRPIKKNVHKTSSDMPRLIPISVASLSDFSEMEEMISPTVNLPTQTSSQQNSSYSTNIWDRIPVNGHYETKHMFKILPTRLPNKGFKQRSASERRADDSDTNSDSSIGHMSYYQQSRIDKNSKSTQSYLSDEEREEHNSQFGKRDGEPICDHTNCAKYFIVKKLGPVGADKKAQKRYTDQSQSELRRVNTPPITRCVSVVTDNFGRDLDPDRPIQVKQKTSLRTALEEDMVLLNKSSPDHRDFHRMYGPVESAQTVRCDHSPIYPEQIERVKPPTFHYVRPHSLSVPHMKIDQSLKVQHNQGGKDLIVSPSGEYYLISSDEGLASSQRNQDQTIRTLQSDDIQTPSGPKKRTSYPKDSGNSQRVSTETTPSLQDSNYFTDTDSSSSTISKSKHSNKSNCWKRRPMRRIPYRVPCGCPVRCHQRTAVRKSPIIDHRHCHKADGRRSQRDFAWESARLAPDEPKRKDEFLGYTSRDGQRYKVYVDKDGDDYMELQGKKLCIPSSLYDPCTRCLELVDKQGKPLSSGDRLIGYDKHGNALLQDRKRNKYVLKVDKRSSLTDQQLEELLNIAKKSGRPSSGELKCSLIGYSRKMNPLLRTGSRTLLELRGTRLDVVSEPPQILRDVDGTHLNFPLNSPRHLVWQRIDGVRVYTLLESAVLLTATIDPKSG